MNKEELWKEATEYAQKLGAKDFIAKPKEIVAYFGYLAGAESREKLIEELNNFIMQSKKDGISPVNALIIKNLGEQLTKAKEIIKQFLSYEQIPRDCLRERYRKLLEDAEQFISEVEK